MKKIISLLLSLVILCGIAITGTQTGAYEIEQDNFSIKPNYVTGVQQFRRVVPVNDVVYTTEFLLNDNIFQDNISVIVNNEKINFDQSPIIIDNRTLVPLRSIFEALGATVYWDNDTQTVTAIKDDATIKLTIGVYEFYKNGAAVSIDVPGMIVNNRTLVPVRAISEAFDCDVEWNGETRTVIIESNEDVNYNNLSNDEKLMDFLQNDFENVYITMQADNYADIEEDDTYITCGHSLVAYDLIDLDGNGDNELVITSDPDYKDYYGKCLSIWDCDKNGEVQYVLAKCGSNSRSAYRYFIAKCYGELCLLETTGDHNSGGKMSARNTYRYDDGKWKKINSIYFNSFDSWWGDAGANAYEIDGEAQSPEYVEQCLEDFDANIEFLFSQIQ